MCVAMGTTWRSSDARYLPCLSNERQPPGDRSNWSVATARCGYWPLLAGSTPANVRKSFMRNDEPADVKVGVHLGFCTR
jgi:hypothetical protein